MNPQTGALGKPLLSILVPTYNAGARILPLLNQMMNLYSRYNNEIAYIIADNSSTDGTRALVQSFQKVFPLILIEGNCNIEFSGNVQRLIFHSVSEWNLIIGDDDILDRDSVEKLIGALRTEPEDDWLLIPCRNSSYPKSSWLTKLTPRRYSRACAIKLIFKQGVSEFGFIGCHVFRNKEIFKKVSLAYSNWWIHLNYFYLHLLTFGGFKALEFQLVETGKGTQEKGYARDLWTELWLQRYINFYHLSVEFGLTLTVWYGIFIRDAASLSNLREMLSFYKEYGGQAAIQFQSILNRLTPKPLPFFVVAYIRVILFIMNILTLLKVHPVIMWLYLLRSGRGRPE